MKIKKNYTVAKNHILFWGSLFSNWAISPFKATVEGKEYEFSNAEQYFMFVKAKTFKDEEIALRILLEGKDPKQAKTLGRLVKGYDDKVWNEMRYQVMLDANIAKYSQNPEMKEILLKEEYRDKGFVECSPIDFLWGVGIAEDNPDADDETKWKGQNLLGKVLNETREILLKEEMN